jgi:hypothetical protein
VSHMWALRFTGSPPSVEVPVDRRDGRPAHATLLGHLIGWRGAQEAPGRRILEWLRGATDHAVAGTPLAWVWRTSPQQPPPRPNPGGRGLVASGVRQNADRPGIPERPGPGHSSVLRASARGWRPPCDPDRRWWAGRRRRGRSSYLSIKDCCESARCNLLTTDGRCRSAEYIGCILQLGRLHMAR